jgi:gliding motility-associated-like protein
VFDTVRITVWDTVPAAAGPDTAICIGESVNLWAHGEPSSLSTPTYLWTPASSLNSDTLAHVVATPQQTTTYTVTISNETCKPATREVIVVVYPLPGADAGEDKVTFAGMPVQLDGTATGNGPFAYAWSPPLGLDCTGCEDPTAQLVSDATYELLITDVNGCQKTDSVHIRVLDRCDGALVYVPNTFTPNDDGINDMLLVRAYGVKEISVFRVFDRWGTLLFESTDPAFGWNGTFKGAHLDPAVFVWTVEGICLNDENFTSSGNVAIVK